MNFDRYPSEIEKRVLAGNSFIISDGFIVVGNQSKITNKFPTKNR